MTAGTPLPLHTATLSDLIALDDPALFEWRDRAREELGRNPDPALQAVYDASSNEIADRAARVWRR